MITDQLRTELVWVGEYDEYGNRREVDVAGMCTLHIKVTTHACHHSQVRKRPWAWIGRPRGAIMGVHEELS